MQYNLIAFLFLVASFLSLWVSKHPRVWGSLLGLSLLFGVLAGRIQPLGLVFIALLLGVWLCYRKKPIWPLFFLVTALSVLLKMRFLPGYTPLIVAPKFALGLEGPLVGLFPLAFVVPLARTAPSAFKDWSGVVRGIGIGCAGIAALALLATFAGAARWHWKNPDLLTQRLLVNFFLTCIPEEGFFRGFIQNRLSGYGGKIFGLFTTSLLFTAMHIYWSPNLAILGFVFLASLLYGTVYIVSGKIESAIVTHFLLNFSHICFF